MDASTGKRTISSDAVSSSSASIKNYPVQIANANSNAPGKMFVYVPWIENGTYVSKGDGISITGYGSQQSPYVVALKAPIYIGSSGETQAEGTIRFILT